MEKQRKNRRREIFGFMMVGNNLATLSPSVDKRAAYQCA